MNTVQLSDALHIVDCKGTAGCLNVAHGLRAHQMLVNEDKLSCGPAPASDDLAQWRSIREDFLQPLYKAYEPPFSIEAHSRFGLLMNAAKLGEDWPVVVWVSTGLPEQLLLAWVVFLFDLQGFDPARLRLVQTETLRKGGTVDTMGMLRPQDYQDSCPPPRALTEAELAALRRAWKAYTSDDTADLLSFLAEPCPLPVLQRALRHLVYRYPDHRNGLGIWDEVLLRNTAAEGPRAAWIVGNTIGTNEAGDVVTDAYLLYRLRRMADADLAAPLVSIAGDAHLCRGTEVRLTSFGEQVLAGEANAVAENGIDDWIGGVNLNGGTPAAYRDGDSLIFPT